MGLTFMLGNEESEIKDTNVCVPPQEAYILGIGENRCVTEGNRRKATDLCLSSLLTFTSPMLCPPKKISHNFSPCWVTTQWNEAWGHSQQSQKHVQNVKLLFIHSLDPTMLLTYSILCSHPHLIKWNIGSYSVEFRPLTLQSRSRTPPRCSYSTVYLSF